MKILKIIVVLIFFLVAVNAEAGTKRYVSPDEIQSKIIALINHIVTLFPEKITEIDPNLDRIALYHIKGDPRYFNANLQQLLEGKILTVFEDLGTPKIVVLPRLNGLKIKSTDSTFSVMNRVPSMSELWAMGKKLRVQAFLEGECSYIHNHGLTLNLRLIKTGSGEVLWSDTFSVFEKELEPVKESNPLYFGVSLGMESYSIDIAETGISNTMISNNFNGRLIYNTLDMSLFQYLPTQRHFRYEIRFGVGFLGNGVKLTDANFSDDTFYGTKEMQPKTPKPVSTRLQTFFYIGMIERKERAKGDWLSVYLTAARHFTKNAPDFNSCGLGLRSDVSRNFSISAGFSIVSAAKFNSVPLNDQEDVINLDVSGIQYHLFLIQYIF